MATHHSVATTTPSAPLHASIADLQTVICCLAVNPQQIRHLAKHLNHGKERTKFSVPRNGLVGQVRPDLVLGHLRVVDGDLGAFGAKAFGQINGRARPGVARVLLESKAEQSDALAPDRVEEGADDGLAEATFWVVVHVGHAAPVLGDFGQVQGLGQVDEVEDVFLEAGAAKADGRFEEAGA